MTNEESKVFRDTLNKISELVSALGKKMADISGDKLVAFFKAIAEYSNCAAETIETDIAKRTNGGSDKPLSSFEGENAQDDYNG